MNITFPNHIETLKAMLKYEVKFLLIGGYAVTYHGYQRTTGDMDLWIQPSNENKQGVLAVFGDLGYSDEDIASLSEYDFRQEQTFHIGQVPDRIDFITMVNLVDFDEAYVKRVEGEIEEGVIIPVVSYKDLITMKFNTGRLKDKADIEELQKINQHRKK
jgi:hypothetical protein